MDRRGEQSTRRMPKNRRGARESNMRQIREVKSSRPKDVYRGFGLVQFWLGDLSLISLYWALKNHLENGWKRHVRRTAERRAIKQ